MERKEQLKIERRRERETELKKEVVDYQGKIARPLRMRRLITPDFSELKWRPYIPLFVYGKEQKGGILSHFLKGVPYLGKAHTLTPHFDLRKSSDGDIFALQKKFQDRHKFTLMGELYAVNVEVLHVLDQALKAKNRYKRVKTNVLMNDYFINGAPRIFGFSRVDDVFMYCGSEVYFDSLRSFTFNPTRIKVSDPRWDRLQFQEYTPIQDNVLKNTIWGQRHKSPHSGITDKMDKRPDLTEELQSEDDLHKWIDSHDRTCRQAERYDDEAEKNRDLVDLFNTHAYGGVETH